VFWSRAVIIAKAANTGAVFIGGSDVDSSTNAGLGATAGTNDSLIIERPDRTPVDMSDVWLDVATNGEGVDFWLFK